MRLSNTPDDVQMHLARRCIAVARMLWAEARAEPDPQVAAELWTWGDQWQARMTEHWDRALRNRAEAQP